MRADLIRRLAALEGESPQARLRQLQHVHPRELSLRELCEYLALFPVEDLRAQFNDEDFNGLLEMIRQAAPTYGDAYVAA